MLSIKEARTELGMTQEQLAKEIGVTQGAVAQWEKGLTHPSFEILPKLAKTLKITLEELIVDKAG